MRLRSLALLLVASSAFAQAQSGAPSAAEQRATEYLASHYASPSEYVLSKFRDHDLVFLGEPHMVRQNLVFLHQLIPQLYQHGVRTLVYEMCLSDDQAVVDHLVNAPTYDAQKALEVEYRWDPQIGWNFQEYADTFRAAWNVNHALAKGTPRFRVVCMDLRPDWSLVKPGEAIVSRPARWKAWYGSNQIARNVWMVGIIRREVFDKHEKAVAYNGFGHTTLVVTRDQREETGLRFSAAYQLCLRYGNRVTAVQLLDAGAGASAGIGGGVSISNVVAALPEPQRSIGFDIKATPVADVPLPEKMAATIVADRPTPLTYADYPAEGFVQLSFTPEPVTPVQGFITTALVEQAKRAGYLPNVPEVNLDWVLQHQQQFLRPAEAK